MRYMKSRVAIAVLALITGFLSSYEALGAPALFSGAGISAPRIKVADDESTASAGPARPNIILILTDDLDARSAALMPQINALLADEGMSFESFFVTSSLCCPSRASILRGQYTHNHQVLGNVPPLGGFARFHELDRESSTVATWLQGAGYRTALLGKYLNGYPSSADRTYVPIGWDEWYSPSSGKPYSGFDYTLNENGQATRYGSQPDDHMTDMLTWRATDFVRRHADETQPFFMYLATYAPHEPATPAPRHRDAFANVQAPRSPSFDEEDVSDKPLWIRRGRPELSVRQKRQLDQRYRRRLQSMLAVDEMVASLVETLRNAGKLESTYIFFTSDNGFHQGEHRLPQGKGTAYEEDIRVPLLVRGPGIFAGLTREHLALNIDLAPTFAELAGVPVPEFVDGRSLVPLLSDEPPPAGDWRQSFVVEHFAAREWVEPAPQPQSENRPGGIPQFRALRTADHLYVEYATGERELYDLRQDPYELESLHDSADPALVGRLSAQLAELWACEGPGCRAADTATVEPSGAGAN